MSIQGTVYIDNAYLAACVVSASSCSSLSIALLKRPSEPSPPIAPFVNAAKRRQFETCDPQGERSKEYGKKIHTPVPTSNTLIKESKVAARRTNCAT